MQKKSSLEFELHKNFNNILGYVLIKQIKNSENLREIEKKEIFTIRFAILVD